MFSQVSPWIAGLLEIVTGAGIITFWVLFFTTDLMSPKDPPEGYFSHEHSFVAPDSIMAVTLIVSGILLMLSNPAGESLSLVCAGGLIFLGAIDTAYAYMNGFFKGKPIGVAKNLAINVWVLALGLFLVLRFAW